jgi:hypothetical protein
MIPADYAQQPCYSHKAANGQSTSHVFENTEVERPEWIESGNGSCSNLCFFCWSGWDASEKGDGDWGPT